MAKKGKRNKYQERVNRELIRLRVLKILVNYKKNTNDEFKRKYSTRELDENEGWLDFKIISTALPSKSHHTDYLVKDHTPTPHKTKKRRREQEPKKGDEVLSKLVDSEKAACISAGKNKYISNPRVYRLKIGENTFLRLYEFFYENHNLRYFLESDYFKDNKRLIIPTLKKFDEVFYKIITQFQSLKKELNKKWKSLDLKSYIEEYATPIYFYIVDKNDFKETMNIITKRFSNEYISKETIKEILALSFYLNQEFENYFYKLDLAKSPSDFNLKYNYLFKFMIRDKIRRVTRFGRVGQIFLQKELKLLQDDFDGVIMFLSTNRESLIRFIDQRNKEQMEVKSRINEKVNIGV